MSQRRPSTGHDRIGRLDRTGKVLVGGAVLIHHARLEAQRWLRTVPQPNLATVHHPRLARTALERSSIVVLGSKYVCDYSWTSTLLVVGITPTTTAGLIKGLPALPPEFTGRPVYF